MPSCQFYIWWKNKYLSPVWRIVEHRGLAEWQVGPDVGNDDSALELVFEELEDCLLKHVSDLVAFERGPDHDHRSHYRDHVVRRQGLALFPEETLFLLDDRRSGHPNARRSLLSGLSTLASSVGLSVAISVILIVSGGGSCASLNPVQLSHRRLLQNQLFQPVRRGNKPNICLLFHLILGA